jgi:hypothetical protein
MITRCYKCDQEHDGKGAWCVQCQERVRALYDAYEAELAQRDSPTEMCQRCKRVPRFPIHTCEPATSLDTEGTNTGEG